MNSSELERVQAEECVRAAVSATPGAIALLHKHLVDNFGEILPWVLMAELTEWVIDLYRSDPEAGRKVASAFFATLERYFDPTMPGSVNVIAVGCLENLDAARDRYSEIVECLGPRMAASEREHPHWPR